MPARPLHFAACVMNTTGHIIQGTWRRPNASRNFGHEGLTKHDERYAWADEYGWIKDLVPDRPATLRDVARYTATNSRIVGTPEQIADRLAEWQAAGVDGINLVNAEIPTSYEEFVDHVIPVLQQRGLAQTEYAGGTLRNKLSGRGDRLPERHPAAGYRKSVAHVR